jgi:uracil-DNA glycosylase
MTAGLSAPLAAHFDSLPPGWRLPCAPFLAGSARATLCRFVDQRLADGAVVYPATPLAALGATGFDAVRVVILGQDPYHGPGQAHGLAFSVPAQTRAPPSLRNILAEVARDAGCAGAAPVSLQRWARQGVLLLNSVLTVEQGRPASHAGQGWEAFTAGIIGSLARSAEPKVFLLWGAQAQAHEAAIAGGAGVHRVLKANHPSPLSARRAPVPFIGCGHFSQANAFLVAHGRTPIDWCAPD